MWVSISSLVRFSRQVSTHSEVTVAGPPRCFWSQHDLFGPSLDRIKPSPLLTSANHSKLSWHLVLTWKMTKYFLGVLLQAWGLHVRMWGSYCCPSVVGLYLDRNLALDPLPLSVTEPAWVPAAPCSVLRAPSSDPAAPYTLTHSAERRPRKREH